MIANDFFVYHVCAFQLFRDISFGLSFRSLAVKARHFVVCLQPVTASREKDFRPTNRGGFGVIKKGSSHYVAFEKT